MQLLQRSCGVVVCAVALVAATLVSAGPAFAGKEYEASAGEATVSGQLLVRFAKGSSPSSVLQQLAPGATSKPIHPNSNIHVVQFPHGAPLGVSSAMAASSDVIYVEPNRIRHSQSLVPNDPQLNAQWALQNLQAMQAWGVAPAGFLTSSIAESGRIRVAVLDTGADCTHPDFMNAGGSSTDTAAGGQLNWSISKAYYPSNAPTPCSWGDDFGHGTHVAGIIAASANNGQGIAGIAYPVEILVYKILDSTGTGDDGKIASAIIDAANNGASVISLSLGAPGYSQTLQLAINYAWQKNALVVAAAGNSGNANLFYPAGANYAIGVAATDINDNLASFSNYGSDIAVGAPGVAILSTVPTYANQEGTTNYDSISGTSMAAPHVSAVAGMIFAANQNMSAAMARMLVEQSADNTNPGGQAGQQLGYGRVNLNSAVSGNPRPSTFGGIVGQIVDINGNAITSNPQISIAGQTQTITDLTGLFRFYGLAPGVYTATVSASGYPTGVFQVGVAAGADTNFTPVLSGSPTQFSGYVTDNGQPVAGAVVEAISASLITSTAVTGPNGYYALYVQPGTYDIQASALYRSTTTAGGQGVGANGNTTVNLGLLSLGTIGGHVTWSNGSAAPNVSVSITGPRNTSATTDANGNFTSIGLYPGGYTVTASASGQPNVSGGASVTADVVSTVNLQFGAGSVSNPNPPSPPGNPPPPQPPAPPSDGGFSTIRVHAGGGPVTDASGNSWSADSGFSGGITYSDSQPIYNAATPALYQSQRWSNGPLQYQFSAPNGPYTVKLKFAETYFTQAGQRLFNISINGQQVAARFDIIAAAGGPNLAVDLTYNTNVTNGQVTIQLTPVVSNPEINAIEIDAGNSNTSPNDTVIRVQAGGGDYTDSLGQLWSADTGFAGGSSYSVTNAIANTADPVLYQTERWDPQTLTYQFAVPNGPYAVTLKYSENYSTGTGQRLFNVVINGQTVENSFDIAAAAGGTFKAVDRTYRTTVTNGQAQIQFVPVLQNPKVDAVQIARH